MRFKFIIILFLFPVSGFGQIITSAQTDKEFYEYGEQINISYELFNGTDSTLQYRGSSSCQAQIKFEHIGTYPNTCTLDDRRYYIYPNQKVNIVTEIDPSEFFYPLKDGTQKIIITYLGFKDSVEFSAPKFSEGSFFVDYDSLKSDTLQQLKNSLSIVETEKYIRNGDRNDSLITISAKWSIDGFQVDELADSLKNTGLFNDIEVVRYLYNSSVIVTSNKNEPSVTPNSTLLNQNYPNPFNPTTTFSFELAEPGNVKLSVFNMIGQEVAVLQNNALTAGKHSINFDGSNLASGTYFYRIKTKDQVLTKKFTLIK